MGMANEKITRRGLFGLLKDPPQPPLPKALPGLVSREAVYVHRTPEGIACGAWSDHMRRAGFIVKTKEAADLKSVKERLRVPPDLAACHSAEIEGYAIEGHVPASAVIRLLREKPEASGLAVAGMPAGAPGVECLEEAEYAVMLFGPKIMPDGRRVYMKFRGNRMIA
ncbi:MAG: hypothetical protein RJB62_1772 [Pseudomonadota bacterium]|jgi:hypothetical protein